MYELFSSNGISPFNKPSLWVKHSFPSTKPLPERKKEIMNTITVCIYNIISRLKKY